jgi:hypothetical protein
MGQPTMEHGPWTIYPCLLKISPRLVEHILSCIHPINHHQM